MRLMLTPACRWYYTGVLVLPGYRVFYEPRADVLYGLELCDSLERLPTAIAAVVLRAASRPAHRDDAALLLRSHALSGGHPAWLQAAINETLNPREPDAEGANP
jgi:hypothetical protein